MDGPLVNHSFNDRLRLALSGRGVPNQDLEPRPYCTHPESGRGFSFLPRKGEARGQAAWRQICSNLSVGWSCIGLLSGSSILYNTVADLPVIPTALREMRAMGLPERTD